MCTSKGNSSIRSPLIRPVGKHTYQLTATEDSPRLEFDAPGSNSVGGVLDEIGVEQIHVEDEPVGLNFDISATNPDNAESISEVLISGIPDGAEITDGQNTFTADDVNGSVDVTDWDLDNISFKA